MELCHAIVNSILLETYMIQDKRLAEKIGLDNKCGYWELNGLYFFNKIECLQHATKHKSYDIKYHLFDSCYSMLDWSKEPSESLETLYKNRARQLRDTYDYIILSFSGGADSTNVLRSFIDNNIKIDEVYSEYPIKPLEALKDQFTGDRMDGKQVAYEWFTAAKPALDNLARTNPEIRITVDDSSENALEIVDSTSLYKLTRSGCIVNLSVLRYRRLYQLARTREKHGRVALVFGMDKPNVVFNTNARKFMSGFSDFTNSFAQESFIEVPGDSVYGDRTTVEMFYITPNFPLINQKQSFEIKKAVQRVMLSRNREMYEHLLLRKTGSGFHVFNIHLDFFKKVLYNKWDTKIWQASKDINFFYQPNMQWFFDSHLTTDRNKDYFDKQILELIHGIDPSLLVYENGKPASLQHYMSTFNSF